ncbi:MAG: T9SS type A sorting domain-containing protein [Bacteroidota bacterium]|nr:T9SS type A sorting domain-containing protein [Bacteroidota bacterium]
MKTSYCNITKPNFRKYKFKLTLKFEKIVIVNSIGQIVFEQDPINLTQANIDIGSFGRGTYFIEIHTEMGTLIKKLIKV